MCATLIYSPPSSLFCCCSTSITDCCVSRRKCNLNSTRRKTDREWERERSAILFGRCLERNWITTEKKIKKWKTHKKEERFTEKSSTALEKVYEFALRWCLCIYRIKYRNMKNISAEHTQNLSILFISLVLAFPRTFKQSFSAQVGLEWFHVQVVRRITNHFESPIRTHQAS